MNRDWVTPSRPGKGYVSPMEATPETPSWRIVGIDKSARVTVGERSGMIRYGRCTEFQSVSELRAFADFVEGNPDFILHSWYHQAPLIASSITVLPDGRIRYDTIPVGNQPRQSITKKLGSIHGSLWVTQKPWEPIPLELRHWIKNKPAYLTSTETTEETDKMPETAPVPASNDTACNTILYGPPGTGKTYNTILQAVGIINGVGPETLLMAEAKLRWDELRREGRIEFVTFHQSYGYEDFVEGIRPVMTDEAGETPRYEVFEGVLKRIALRALGAMLEPRKLDKDDASEEPAPLPFSVAWECLTNAVSNHEFFNFESEPFRVPALRSGKLMAITQITERGRVKNNEFTERSFSRSSLARVYAEYSSRKSYINTPDVAYVEGEKAHNNFIAAVYNYIKSKEDEWRKNIALFKEGQEGKDKEEADPVQAAQDYLALGNASGYQLNTRNQPRYVLVIDEINRGNISKIFGELITLIEDDKRIGGEVALTVTLPHSRETFGLPSNLYILGTMNTADKSIALVDVALRRRFEFEEMLPDFSESSGTCPDMTGEMRAAIVRLNERIELRKDRDHQIGHAFFRAVASPEDFNRVFAKKIIPLLQEYFYGDWESLRWVLGETGERDSSNCFIVPLRDEPGARNRWQWFRDAGQDLDILGTLVQNYK